MPDSVGGFELGEVLGHGGAGEVRAAVHRRTGLPAAVKLLHPRWRSRAAWLRHEAQAVARLDHPHIIDVYDVGLGEADAPEGAARGQPWLAMERVSGGSLAELERPLSWPELRITLLALLDALAHAHARGIVHRDLKPANVLRAGPGDLRPGLKLTDFGIARLPTEGAQWSAGTPRYMAPEQFDRRISGADVPETQASQSLVGIGPWTDLYALGGLAWVLWTGQPPFTARDVRALAQAHRSAPLPPLSVPGPPGFEAWLRRSLQKQPADRFQQAAEAAAALRALPMIWTPIPEATEQPQTDPDATCLTTLAPIEWGSALDEHPIAELASGVAPLAPRPVPTCPADWRPPVLPPSARARRLLLGDVGEGVLPLRHLPLMGRGPEQDALWATLRGVLAHRRPALALIVGARGLGRRALLRWLSTRAAELGVVQVIEGAEALSLDHLGAQPDARPLLLLPGSEAKAPEALGRLEQMLTQSARPILVGMTLSEAEETAQPERAARLRTLATAPGGCLCELAPLDEVAHQRLINALGVVGAAAARVDTVTAGRPAEVQPLVVAWLKAGRLAAGPEGLGVGPMGLEEGAMASGAEELSALMTAARALDEAGSGPRALDVLGRARLQARQPLEALEVAVLSAAIEARQGVDAHSRLEALLTQAQSMPEDPERHRRLIEVEALWSLGQIERLGGAADSALARYQKALDLLDAQVPAEARWWVEIQIVAGHALMMHASERTHAAERYHAALQAACAHGLKRAEATAIRALGRAARLQGDLDTAEARVVEARARYAELEDDLGVHACVADLGDLARARGDLATAAACYRRVVIHDEIHGHVEVVIDRLNLGLTELAAGWYERAEATLSLCQRRLAVVGWRPPEACAWLALCVCAGARQDRAGWLHAFHSGRTLIEATGTVEPDLAEVAEQAAEVATQQGWSTEARQAQALAQAQRNALKSSDTE